MGVADLLSVADRRRLRAITRAVHLRFYPVEHLTDHECDKFIDSLTPELIAANLKAGRDSGLVE